MEKLLKVLAKLCIIPMLGVALLASCSFQDEDILEDINLEVTDEEAVKKK